MDALRGLIEKWRELELKWQWLACGCVLLVVFYLSYYGLWTVSRDQYLHATTAHQEAILLEQQIARLAEIGYVEAESQNQNINLISLVSNTAEEANVRLARLLPSQDEQSVTIDMEQIQFGNLMRMLSQLEQAGIEISTLSVESSAREGYISARALLSVGS